MWSFEFFFMSILFGFALAMDAFSVSLANGLNERCMSVRKMCGIAGVFSFFQGLMPMIGWICVHTILTYFSAFEKFIPWIALVLLSFIGGKMLLESKKDSCEGEKPGVGFVALVVQGVATSIDALSVGFDIATYNVTNAIVCALIIALLTFGICMTGLCLGKKFGTALAGKASILGGVILIAIGIEIFLTGIL